jgi:hypothetical protein
MRSFRLGAACAGLAAAAALAGAAPAMAAVTSSTITSVTTPDGFTANPVGGQLFSGWSYDDASKQSTVVSGTVTTDDNNAADTVDVRCYWGDGGNYSSFETGVTVNPDGTFATGPQTNSDQTCHLAAVDPSYGNPLDSTKFQGPVYGIGYQEDDYRISGGPNDGQRYNLFSDGHQAKGYMEWESSGYGGLAWTQPLSASHLAYGYYSPWDYAAALYTGNYSGDNYGRSEIQVDGKDAYNTYGAYSLTNDGNGHNAQDNGNYPTLTWTNNVDPLTGDMTITESEPLVDCGSTPYPATAQCDQPSNATQASFNQTGVTFDRSVKQSKDGQQATVTDTYTSSDGAQHALDVEYDQYSDEESYPQYKFPGSDYHYYFQGDSVDLPAQAVGSILVYPAYYGDSAEDYGIPGAMTYLTQPDRAFFNYGSNEFALQYRRTVPAGGSVSITHVFSVANDMAQVKALAAQAEDAAQPPSVSIDSPATGSTVGSDSVTVIGKAADNSGSVALKVNGIPTPVSPDGTWSQRVPLSAGGNTVTAVGTDPSGNSAQASETLNYVAVKSSCSDALQAAACSAGKQKAVYSGAVKAGNVAAQGSATGTLLAIGTPVDFSVSRGPFPSARLASSKVRLKGNRLIIAVRCSSTGSATNGTIKLRKVSGKHQTLGTKSFQCPSGKKRNVSFVFTSKTAKALHKAKKIRVDAYIVSRGPEGAAASRRTRFTVLG